MLIASTFLLWIMVALLVVAVISLARQVGTLNDRLAQAAGLVAEGGPRVGDPAPMIAAPGLGGGVVNVGGPDAGGRAALLLFVTPDSPVCKAIIPVAMILARSEGLRLVFVGDGDARNLAAMVDRFRMTGFDFALSGQVVAAYQASVLPWGVLIGGDGRVRARGAVSAREHLESLIAAGDACGIGAGSGSDDANVVPMAIGAA
ncbi:methylamine utilization protein MauD [Sphingomonas sanxanigenens]|uniref:Thioredoxin domain-containing protein n=1 Tax=Sphingomonas sanxanigenens DSM 19645 = NX02 TaxID=1123269 RepID=W0A5A8_9SPHN|nr:methylamine utilization protein MauD [Sphingomonas sanxanigenens]AHE53134.1 hypothetical protein NX02_07035 [Sphingomonas sanxanigenens DSM 19645 = NX02]